MVIDLSIDGCAKDAVVKVRTSAIVSKYFIEFPIIDGMKKDANI